MKDKVLLNGEVNIGNNILFIRRTLLLAKKKGNKYIVDEANNIAKIELTRRDGTVLWTTIDLEDLEKVINFPYTWSAKYDPDLEQYYVETTIYCGFENGKKLGKALKLHKFIMDAKDDEVVDHIDHDTLHNTKGNLRCIPWSNNSTNRKSRNKNNKSGYRNVSWSKNEKKWIVQLSIDKKNKILGRFPYEELDKAGAFAEEMRQKYYGEFAGSN